MGQRFYSSVAGASALATSISDTATSVNLTSTAGLPAQFPFTLVLDPGSASEEIVTVTALSGSSATITRGEDGSSAQSHQAGAVVRHMATGRDFREPQQHIDAVAIVHGVTGRVVGTTDTQTIQNKTFDTSNVFPATPKASLPADTVYTTGTQTLTGKTISGASNTLTNIPKSALPGDIYYGTSAALPSASLSHFGARLTSVTTPARVSWSSGDVVSDPSGMWSAANPTRLTAQRAGTYLVSAFGARPDLRNESTSVQVYKNGTQVALASSGVTSANSIPTAISHVLTLSIGDYLEVNLDIGATGSTSCIYSLVAQQIG
jgi:hypothetical protein